MFRILLTVDDVFAELGNALIMRLTGASSSAVSNWRADGRFPAKTYLVLANELKRRECAAPPELWGMLEAARA
jgi:hypothetical protein